MWWLDPGKEILNVIFNRILAPYVDNLDLNQVSYGIAQGQLTLRNLRLKKGALDLLRLPVDVLDGHLGRFTLSLYWMNLGNKPVEILIEDVYLLVVPSPRDKVDPQEEEERFQAAKAERLANAEALHLRGQTDLSTMGLQQQGLFDSLIAKVINNIQVTVKNIYIRYEDGLSVPGRPFALGITLAELSAVSVDGNWQPAFIETTAGAIRKLAKLQSLAVYFNSDSLPVSGLSREDIIKNSLASIPRDGQESGYQFILRPVSGEGRIMFNHTISRETPRLDMQWLFDEISLTLDHAQYLDTISLVDMYHVHLRRHQYIKFRPKEEEIQASRAKAMLTFAIRAIHESIRDRNRKWTWAYFKERRDDRKKYVDLFQKKLLSPLSGEDVTTFGKLEKKLSFEDLRFYRSIARSQIRKDQSLRKRLVEENAKKQTEQSRNWTSWLWGSSQTEAAPTDPAFSSPMTEQQRKELYDALDYDEKKAIAESVDTPRDAMNTRIIAKLNKGTFSLKTDQGGRLRDVISVVFEQVQATLIQRPNNFEATVSLAGFSVFDGISDNTLYPQIVQVKKTRQQSATSAIVTLDAAEDSTADLQDPFFSLKFEMRPLDERADSALAIRMRHMEIIYHKGYVEAVYKFFRPPASQLESVEALLTVASQTLEGLRKETRAGLEFALQNHKTIDVQMDLNAPIVIIPEDITTFQCKHLVIDAGHISIESDLVDKKVIREINLKRHQQYGDKDYEQLESVMYDKMLLKFEAAQFLIGNDLQSCQHALASDSDDALHLLERININLQLYNSIVPMAPNIVRFKVSGQLPTLQLNMSDSKYKSLMRLIDVCVPRFEDDLSMPPDQTPTNTTPAGFQLPPLFPQMQLAYGIVEDAEDTSDDQKNLPNTDRSLEVDGGGAKIPEWHQHICQVEFQVGKLQVSLSKQDVTGKNKALGDLVLERFALSFWLAKFDLRVDISLRSLSMNLIQARFEPIKFASSSDLGEQCDKDLLTVVYKRVQKASPDFIVVYDGIDQVVDIKISTFVFRIAPEPVVALYDFVMTTFVNSSGGVSVEAGSRSISDPQQTALTHQAPPNTDKIRVVVDLASVEVILVNDGANLGTLSLATASVTLLLQGDALRVSGRLGSLALQDESELHAVLPDFKRVISIEDDNFAVFGYETFDSHESSPFKSSFFLTAGSVKVHFLEKPLHDYNLFITKLARLKGLYDAAAYAAVQKASEIERLQFEVSIRSPIVVFPINPSQSPDVFVMRLGEISAKNFFQEGVSKAEASLRGIQLVSKMYYNTHPSELKLVYDIDIAAQVTYANSLDRTLETEIPDNQVLFRISDIKLDLTQVQYRHLIEILESIPRIMALPSNSEEQEMHTLPHAELTASNSSNELVDLDPELRSTPFGARWTNIDLVLTVDTVKLHLYDSSATETNNLKDHGVARFALNCCELRLKVLSDGSSEAQIVLKSLTMSNTRPTQSQFREIIPAAHHGRNQFMLLYTASGGKSGTAVAILTVDFPQIIFTIDPVIALLDFFTSTFAASQIGKSTTDIEALQSPAEMQPNTKVDFRIDVHNVAISVLEDDADPESQAIMLAVQQISLSQQAIMVLTISRLGMSLVRMGKPSERVRFLDDVDINLSLDNRMTSSQNMSTTEIVIGPLVFRVSYRDINLIMNIFNRAYLQYEDFHKSLELKPSVKETSLASELSTEIPLTTASALPRSGMSGYARVLTSKEQLTVRFDGFRLVIIGDLHEQPMLHIKTKPFELGAKDWSGEFQASTTMAASISYWNISNSHWEPLIDPWTFKVSVAKDMPAIGIKASLSAWERLDVNISTAFAELVMNTANMWGKEGVQVLQKARGSYAPYRICNRTGSPLLIWPDVDGSSGSSDPRARRLGHDEVIDWRFDDWKAMREHVGSPSQHSLGLQFIGKPWDPLRNIPVDRESSFTFSLRPAFTKYRNRLLCEVSVHENTKIVTFRSIYGVENLSLYPLELTLVNEIGQPVCSLEKLAPGQHYSLPIDMVTQSRVRIQPDQGFGYKWCTPISWEELLNRQSFTIQCPHTDPQETPFCFQAWVDSANASPRKYSKIDLKLRAPIELENLLPYNVQYRIYDRDADQTWRSYLRSGGLMPVHSVEVGHVVLLNIDIQDAGFQLSNFVIINTGGRPNSEAERCMKLQKPNEQNLNLRLQYVQYSDSGGAFKVQIYSPYLVINKTSLPFAVKGSQATRASQLHQLAENNKTDATPCMLSHPSDNGHDFVFRVGDSEWSKRASLEAPAAEMALATPSQRHKEDVVHIGLSWAQGIGKYKLTKIMTIAPRFMLKSNLSQAISFRQHGVPPRERHTIEPQQQCALYTLRGGKDKLLTIAFLGLASQWSTPINIEDIGSVHFRLQNPRPPPALCLIRADVKINASTIFVSFNHADDSWPFRIENDSDCVVKFCQTDSKVDTKPMTVYRLDPHTSMEYAWDHPATRGKRITLIINGSRRSVDIMEIGSLLPFKLSGSDTAKTVSLDVRADGYRQVLRITKYEPQHSVYKLKNFSDRASSIAGNMDVFEAKVETTLTNYTIQLDLAGIGISLMNRKLVEVIYMTASHLKFEFIDSSVSQAITLSVGSTQIDNQLHDAIFPVILQPTPVDRMLNGLAPLPTIQGSVVWLKDQEHGVFFIKYCSILLQALTIEVDEDLLFAVYDLTQIKGAWEGENDEGLLPQVADIVEPNAVAPVGQDLYFEVLELQPMQFALSFMRTDRVGSDERLSLRNPFAIVVNALTMVVGNINDAPLEMNALGIKDMRLTVSELQTRIIYHYRQDILRQLYRILGSADFIGNPVGLFTNVSSGVADIFYEPFHGMVMHGNKEIGIGIAKGAASFVKKTVFGFSDSVTKFTSSVGKGLSAATFDSEYQVRRRTTQRRNKPRHALYGVTVGSEALVSSVASAVEGIVMKPIEGAESDGAFGFFKGVGKGLVGAVTKPVVGVFDLASNVAEGIRNTTTVFDDPARDRVRLPRLVPADGILRAYSAREALGQYWLKDLENGAYRNESYVAHITSPGGDHVTLLTTSQLLSFWSNKLRMDWELPLAQVKSVSTEDTGLRFTHRTRRELERFVLIPEKPTQSWFFSQVASVVKAFNARKRMDT